MYESDGRSQMAAFALFFFALALGGLAWMRGDHREVNEHK